MAGVVAPPPTSEEGVRRRAGVQVVAAAAAMAAVVVGSAVMADRGHGGGLPGPEPPTPTPTVLGDWLDVIPAGFPLDRGLDVDPRGAARSRTARDPHPTWADKVGCRPVSSAERLDARRSWAARGHLRRSHELALFPDEAAAAQQLADLQNAAIGCSDRAFLASDQVLRYSFTPLAEDRALLEALRYDGSRRVPGRQAVVVAQVGNAVLLAALQDGSTAAEGVSDAAARDLVADVDALVERMCVFAEHPCSVDGPAEAGS
jgi:hypothetical protein